MNTGQIQGLFPASAALTSLLDHLPLGVVVIGPDQRIRLVNQPLETLIGFGQEHVQGLPCRHVLRHSLCHGRCPWEKVLRTGQPVTAKGDLIDRLRRKVPVSVTASPIRDVSGRIVGLMETVEDVTDLDQVQENLRRHYGFGRLLGRCPQMEGLFATIPVIAQTDSSVLITGETGTGKDALAEVIHEASDRSQGPFVKINCGALPENLLESELFGHQRGAFTGAVGDKPGRLRLAHTGTLYLTEIGDLPLSLQVKLLTFLDDKVVYPLGGTKGLPVDVRIVAATHRDLEAMVREGTFRQDLLYRLNVVRLHVPPLRERGDDVELLMDHFLKIFAARFGKKIKSFDDAARQILLGHPFPGNVRELRNVIEYATNVCQEEPLALDHLPAYLGQGGPLVRESDQTSLSVAAPGQMDGRSWADVERQMILDALVKAKGRRSQAAQLLGWCRSTLWRKMKQHELEA